MDFGDPLLVALGAGLATLLATVLTLIQAWVSKRRSLKMEVEGNQASIKAETVADSVVMNRAELVELLINVREAKGELSVAEGTLVKDLKTRPG